MTQVAVLGGGPAGAFAAEHLASSGVSTVVLDENLAWEKPCGGGLTYKAYSRYPFLLDNDTPKRLISRTRLSSEKAGTAQLDLTHPLLIYSRYELNSLLLQRAERAGAQIEKERVLTVERRHDRWLLRTRSGTLEARFCIVATGARNPLRNVGTIWSTADTMSSLGYFIPATQDHVDLQFFPSFEGYIWIFPRSGHLSAGIAGKGRPAQQMREMLQRYLAARGIGTKDAVFYGHVIPSLNRSTWRTNRIAGEGWIAVGDAAGFVDPVTGEGLYYAIRSAELAAQSLLTGADYRGLVGSELIPELELGSFLSCRFFRGRFLYNDVTTRMIQLARCSPTICGVLQDLFAGTQGYLDLRQRLKTSASATMSELLMSFCRSALTLR